MLYSVISCFNFRAAEHDLKFSRIEEKTETVKLENNKQKILWNTRLLIIQLKWIN